MRLDLIVSDRRLREELLRTLRSSGHLVNVVQPFAGISEPSRASAIVIDVDRPADLETIEVLREESDDRIIIALGADPGAVLATRTRRAGANEFLRKPFGVEDLERALTAATHHVRTQRVEEFLTADPGMLRKLEEIDRAAVTEATIRLRGESGTGKALLAQRIHQLSPRHEGPFVVMGCAGLPQGRAESELLGHAADAFDGASDPHVGILAAASSGTLVLDDVDELDRDLQARLLHALQEQQVTPLGTNVSERLDLRIIATTRRDLAEEVSAGRFRRDLHFRLDVIEFQVPSLRERPADIPLLAHASLNRFARQQGSEPPRLREEDQLRLIRHPFPGNVRELQNMMRRATILFAGRDIDLDALLSRRVADAIPRATLDTFNLRELEKETIHRALEARGGNRTQAARALGISVRTLRNKIQAYGLADRPRADRAICAGSIAR